MAKSYNIEVWRRPTKGEVKFGYGSLHYRNITVRTPPRGGQKFKVDGKTWTYGSRRNPEHSPSFIKALAAHRKRMARSDKARRQLRRLRQKYFDYYDRGALDKYGRVESKLLRRLKANPRKSRKSSRRKVTRRSSRRSSRRTTRKGHGIKFGLGLGLFTVAALATAYFGYANKPIPTPVKK